MRGKWTATHTVDQGWEGGDEKSRLLLDPCLFQSYKSYDLKIRLSLFLILFSDLRLARYVALLSRKQREWFSFCFFKQLRLIGTLSIFYPPIE
jgi:hypothetical protein